MCFLGGCTSIKNPFLPNSGGTTPEQIKEGHRRSERVGYSSSLNQDVMPGQQPADSFYEFSGNEAHRKRANLTG